MDKRTRQYIGLFSAIIAYYVIHEGAHLVYALCIGVFKPVMWHVWRRRYEWHRTSYAGGGSSNWIWSPSCNERNSFFQGRIAKV